MKVKITYWEGGNTWSEIIRANNVQDARKQAEQTHPTVKIIASNPVPQSSGTTNRARTLSPSTTSSDDAEIKM